MTRTHSEVIPSTKPSSWRSPKSGFVLPQARVRSSLGDPVAGIAVDADIILALFGCEGHYPDTSWREGARRNTSRNFGLSHEGDIEWLISAFRPSPIPPDSYQRRHSIKFGTDVLGESVVYGSIKERVQTQPKYHQDHLEPPGQFANYWRPAPRWVKIVSAVDGRDDLEFAPYAVTTIDVSQLINSEWEERLEYLSKLGPNWDGCGAAVISESAIATGSQVLTEVAGFPDPRIQQLFIAPLADGGLELEWELASGNELMIVVPHQGGPVEFLLTTVGPWGDENESDGMVPEDASMDTLFRRVTA